MKIFHHVDELNKELKKLEGKKIVFTNGVFDLIHAGHIELLEFAKTSGDYLILGINDDASVKRLKGKNRPIYPLAERMEILEAIMYVDFIIPFAEDTPLELIKSLHRVDVLVKRRGLQNLTKWWAAARWKPPGGRLLLFDFHTHSSTSDLLRRIKKINFFIIQVICICVFPGKKVK